ncbi:hypothetical protein HY629_02550 [Candidatus Uhrbacteria bacterium]|nr:hypothetical protein [Candidatus Uhrbacteria bacterium]
MSFLGKAVAFAAGVGTERLLRDPKARAKVAKAYRRARTAAKGWARDFLQAIEAEEHAEAHGAKKNGAPKGKGRTRAAGSGA